VIYRCMAALSLAFWVIGTPGALASVGGRPRGGAPDLDVAYIRRTPRYQRYNVGYDPPGHNPVILNPGQQRWPAAGETVTFTAFVTNKGTFEAQPFEYEWYLDGNLVASGVGPPLEPGFWARLDWQWTWDSEWVDHEIKFVADPHNQYAEISENNNVVADATNALTFVMTTDRRTYDWFAELVNPRGSYSFEDWLRIQIDRMNQSFAECITELCPDGIKERVRIDCVVITDDPTHSPEPADPGALYGDGHWNFYAGDRSWVEAEIGQIDWALLHELGHQLGRIDLYQMDCDAVNTNNITRLGWFNSFRDALMHNVWSRWSSYHGCSLNRDLHKRRGFFGEYLLDVPAQNRLRILDRDRKPVPWAEVRIYQRQDSGPYAGQFGVPPARDTMSNSQGYVDLGPAPFGNINIVGANTSFLIEIFYNGWSDFQWTDILPFNVQYWQGRTQLCTIEVLTNHSTEGRVTTNDLLDLDMIDETRGYAVGRAGTVLHFVDGVWSTFSSPTTADLCGVAAWSDDNVWAVGSDTHVFHWDGSQWHVLASPTPNPLLDISMVGPQELWISANRDPDPSKRVFHTTDGGGTWTRQDPVSIHGIRYLKMLDSQHGFLGGSYGTGEVTFNGGATWTPVSPTMDIMGVSFPPGDQMHGYALTWASTVMETFDGGRTWQQMYDDPGTQVWGIAMTSHDSGWIVGDAGGFHDCVIRRYNGNSPWTYPGKWELYHLATRHPLWAVEAVDDYEAWTVGDGGTIAHLFGYPRYTSRMGYIAPGWNWISIPAVPAESADPKDIFGPENVSNRLFLWDEVGKTFRLYPDDFQRVEVGRGYFMRVEKNVQATYLGTPTPHPFEIPMPSRGWSLIGHPYDTDLELAQVRVRNNATGETRSPQEDNAAPDHWVNWNWLYWDSAQRTVRILGIQLGSDDDSLRPWRGYCVWTEADDLTLIVP
jgi:photosystem II stability/assembly factor-like uncharacterized protein